ncbi:MAG: MDR family oxidoreductase [Pseudomonadota bacterium]|nr:MDR family oxidoreductase [Pseudomonadota bacterium]
MRAWIQNDKETRGGWAEIDEVVPAEGEALIRVTHSAINYKDGLALTGTSPIFRSFPMVPGIDVAGVVEHDPSGRMAPGTDVVITGHGMGETRWGGYAEKLAVPSDWLIAIPSSMSNEHAAAIGTAGLTAALCLDALEDHGVRPDSGPMVITGASGGVGGYAVALASTAGFDVKAVSGRSSEKDYLTGLGASEVVDRAPFEEKPRALGKEQWASAIDVAGGEILANVISGMQYGGAVAACGLAQSMNLPTSVAPFILRSVALLGVDSVYAPPEKRARAWGRFTTDVVKRFDPMLVREKFDAVDGLAQDLLDQKVRGRVVLSW